MTDCDTCEMANIAARETRREIKARWTRLRTGLKFHLRNYSKLASVAEEPKKEQVEGSAA